jgi:hypothetical protein
MQQMKKRRLLPLESAGNHAQASISCRRALEGGTKEQREFEVTEKVIRRAGSWMLPR